MKRLSDIIISSIVLILTSPVLIVFSLLIFLQDFRSPFYVSYRTGKNEKPFKMIKIRSMVINADKSGVDSTSAGDSRITSLGKIIRKYKIDELAQLINVLFGDMSLVGPRPNVKRETDIYTDLEKSILLVQPGITDISSIVFSDEEEILKYSKNPDIDYNQLIRPGKSWLCIYYIQNWSLILDFKILILTFISIFNKKLSLLYLSKVVNNLSAPKFLIEIVERKKKLVPMKPPGSNDIITSRN